MRKIFTLLLAMLAATLGALATDYGIYIGDTQLTSSNYQNISTKGVTFDPMTNTLTLTDASLATYRSSTSAPALRITGDFFPIVTLKLVGSNSITTNSYTSGALEVSGTRLNIVGPGSLRVVQQQVLGNRNFGIKMNGEATLTVVGVSKFTTVGIAGFNESGSQQRSVTIIRSAFSTSQRVMGISNFDIMYGMYENNANYGLKDTQMYDLDANSVLSSFSVVPFLMGDMNHDGELNATDARAIVDHITYGSDQEDNYYDLTMDGKVNTSDITMLYNVATGSRSGWYRIPFLAHTLDYSVTLNGLPITYTATGTTYKFIMLDFGSADDIVDYDPSHFAIKSSNPSVASVAISLTGLPDERLTCCYAITVKGSGYADITLSYDDGEGNYFDATVPLTFLRESDLIQTSDRIYGATINGSAIQNMALNTDQRVPVGTSFRLTIDKAQQNGYGLTERKTRVGTVTWTTNQPTIADIEPTGDGYVNVTVKKAGRFTVTATDAKGNERTVTLYGSNIYGHNGKQVYQNDSVIFTVPKTKALGKDPNVWIEKILRDKWGRIWTVVNHYNTNLATVREQYADKVLGRMTQDPYCAQVYRDGVLWFESEDAWIRDIAEDASTNQIVVVGSKYNPNIDCDDWGDKSGLTGAYASGISDKISVRLSDFWAVLSEDTKGGKEHLNDLGYDDGKTRSGWNNESHLTRVAYDTKTKEIVMAGYKKRRRSVSALIGFSYFTSYCYARDWTLHRINLSTGQAASYVRGKNDHWSFNPYGLAIAKGEPRVIAHETYYEPLNSVAYFKFSSNGDYFMYDLTKTDGNNGFYISDDEGGKLSGITSSGPDSPLYGWHYNKIFRFSDDCKSYSTLRAYEDINTIADLKVILNSGQEEFFTISMQKDGGATVVRSVLGDAVIPVEIRQFDM